MHSPGLLRSSPPSLSDQLKRRTNELQSGIVRANYNTQFAQTAPDLNEFRLSTAGLVRQMDDDTLSESFRQTVHFTTYDSYAPLLARLLEKPCKASAIVDLLAPGLPDYVVVSSTTSGGREKIFPKYNRLSEIRASDSGSWTTSDPLRRRTTAFVWYFWCNPMDIEDENHHPVTRMYQAISAVVHRRSFLNLDPERDNEKMGTFILDHAAPYATGFIKKWRSFLLIHALFAVGSRSLETMSMGFISTFVDMIRHLDMEFDMVVDCIANGAIPDLDGIADVRHYLEINISPDPERAAELRSLGRPSSQPGWCGHVWPNLRSITTVASGSFASSIPLAQWYLGPNVDLHARGYPTTEVWVGSPYNPLELNQFKPNGQEIIEFLDIKKSDSISALAQLWEVELGRRYELVATTQDGLWRYRLGDVVEICGFDPSDGVPIFQFVERRNITIRFPLLIFTEEELRAAIAFMAQSIGMKVVDWTATSDSRRLPATIGFFVEFAGDDVPDLARVAEHALDGLTQSHEIIPFAIKEEYFRMPTIRVVQPGTFSAFRQLKLDEGSNSLGQVKVPVVLPKATYVTWFLDRVVQDL